MIQAIRRLFVVALMFGFGADPGACADDEFNIRRVYVPADRVPELGTSFPDLRSLSREEFDELLRRARSADAPVLPFVESARYEAQFDGSTFAGTAELAVRGRPAAQSLLRWPASAWRITEPKWAEQDAQFGYAGNGELGLVVPAGNSHTLTFRWSAATRPMEAGRSLEIELPPSIRADLILDLPPGLVPRLPRANTSGPTDAPRPELKRWTIRVTRASTVRLLLLQDGRARQPTAQVFYERELDADVAEDSTELVARFNLNVAHEPIRRIEVEHSPGLVVYSWSGLAVYDWESRGDRLVLELSEPLSGPAQLTLRALAAGPACTRWKLPRLALADAHWCGGRTRVRGVSAVHLFDVQAERGRIVSRLGSALTEPEFAVEHAVPDPGLSAAISLERPCVFVRVHSTLQFAPQPAAIAAVRWHVGTGEIAELRLRVPPAWSVESVESPQGLLARWALENGATPRDAERGRVLNLRLNRPLSDEAMFQAIVTLRGPELDARAPNINLELPRLAPLDSDVAEETIAIEPGPAWTFDVESANGLTPVARVSGMGPSPPSAAPVATYRFDTTDAVGRLALRHEAPEFVADVDTAIELDTDTIRARYAIDVDLMSGQPESIDIRFSTVAREQLAWDLPAGARVEPLVSGVGSVAATDESWRIVLPPMVSRRVHLAADWRRPVSDSIEVPLPFVSGAAAATGDVSVSAPAELSLASIAEGLVPIAAPSGGDRVRSAAAARERAWRYSQSTPRLRLQLGTNSTAAQPAAWLTRVHASTDLDAAGEAIHCVRFYIHSPVGTECTIELPSGAELRRAHSSDGPVTRTDAGSLRAVRSSAGPSWYVAIEYSESTGPLGRWSPREFRLPRVSLPSLRTTWDMRVPTSHRPAMWSHDFVVAPPHAGESWLWRLFGPLARTNTDEPFRFWTANAWQAWWAEHAGTRVDPLELRLADAIGEFRRDVRPRERTWERLLEHVDQVFDHQLIVDAQALDATDFDSSALVRFSDDAGHDALAALDANAEACFVRTHHGLAISTRTQADATSATPKGARLRRLNGRGGLEHAVDQVFMNGIDPSGRFVLWENWAANPIRSASDTVAASSTASARDAWRFECPAEASRFPVTFVPSAFARTASVVIVVLSVLVACMLRPSATRWRIGLFGFISGISFALALVLPDAISPPAAALAWSQLALAVVAARRPREVSAADRRAAEDLPSTLRAAVTGAIVVAAVSTPRLLGQEEAPPTRPDSDAIVFIPFNPEHPERRHEATRVLVPRSLHERLIAAARSATTFDRGVLVRSANYAAKLEAGVATISIDLDIENLSPDQPSRCPLALSGLLIRQALLDDAPCLLRQERHGFSVELAAPGVHRLHLEGALPVENANGQHAINVTIPPVPAAAFAAELSPRMHVELDGSSRPPVLETSPEATRVKAELGAVSSLVVRWGREPATPPAVQVDAAYLWSWFAGPPQLHARLHAHVDAGQFTRLAVDADSRLTIKRVNAPGLARYWVRPGNDAAQLVLEFERPVSSSVSVDLEFLLVDATENETTLPDLHVADARPRAKVVSLRTDAAHRVELVEPANLTSITSEEFQAIWGQPLAAAESVRYVRASGRAAALTVEKVVQTAPARMRTSATVRVGRGRIETRNHIAIDAAAGNHFRHELRLPPGVHLSSVRASAGSQWQRVADDLLVWFGVLETNPAPTALPTIDVETWAPIGPESVPLPIVRPADDTGLSGELVFWRSRDATLSIAAPHGLTESKVPSDARPPSAEFVADATYTIDAADCSATLSTERQTATRTASVATRLTVDNDEIEWVTALEFQMSGGAIDAVEFALPPGMTLPIEIEGEGIGQRTVRTDGDSRIWRIVLSEPRWSSYRLLLRSRWPNTGDGMRVPIVSPIGVAETRRYVLILNATERRAEVRGIEGQPTVTAESFARWFSEPATSNVAAAVELGDAASPIDVLPVEIAEPARRLASVLERHRVWLRPGNESLVQSRVLFQSRSAGDVALKLPQSSAVLEVRVDGERVAATTNDVGHLVVQLTARYRPHELSLLWRWPVLMESAAARADEFRLPRLTESACPSVWTVHARALDRVTVSGVGPACRSLAKATQAEALLDEIIRMLPLPTGVDATEPGEVLWDVERSFLATVYAARRVAENEAQVGLATWEERAAHERARDRLSELLEQNRRIIDEAGLASLLARSEAQLQRRAVGSDSLILAPEDETDGVEQSSEFRAELEVPPGGQTRYVVARDSTDTVLHVVPDARGTASLAALVVAGLAATLVVLVITWPRAQSWTAPITLVGAGVVWSAALYAEPVGMALIAAGMFALLVRVVRRRRTASESPATAAS